MRTLRIRILSLALLASAVAAPAQAGWDWATSPSVYDKEGQRQWGIDVTPYLWASSLRGDVGIPAAGTVPIDATFSDLASSLDAGLAGVVDIRYRRWHLVSDNSWVKLDIEDLPDQGLITSARVEPALAFGTVGIAYELPLPVKLALDLYLAARWWHISTDLAVTTVGPGGPFGGSFTETWADAVGGARIRYSITDKWRVSVQGDVGGGQADIDWSLLAAMGYDFNRYLGLTVGYRVLGVDYTNGPFAYDTVQSGLVLGFRLGF